MYQEASVEVSFECLKNALYAASREEQEQIISLANLGACCLRRLKPVVAIRYLRRATLVDESSDVQSRARNRLNLCAALNMLGEHNEALEQARPLPCLTSPRRSRALATPIECTGRSGGCSPLQRQPSASRWRLSQCERCNGRPALARATSDGRSHGGCGAREAGLRSRKSARGWVRLDLWSPVPCRCCVPSPITTAARAMSTWGSTPSLCRCDIRRDPTWACNNQHSCRSCEFK